MGIKIAEGTSYFLQTTEQKIFFNSFEKEATSERDIVIVGGGITGLLAAYYLSQLDRKITIFEMDLIGHASSSISTSIMQYELEDVAYDLIKDYSEKEIYDFYNFGLTGLNEFEVLLKETKIDCDYTKRISLLYTNVKSDVKKIQYEHEFRKKYGFNSTLIDENNKIVPFPVKKGIISKNSSAHINPYKFTSSLAKYLSQKWNVEIFEKSKVLEWSYSNGGFDLLVNENKVTGKDLVVCVGYDTSIFSKKEYGDLYRTYNIVTSPLKAPLWQDNIILKSADKPYFYGRDTVDGRVILGGCDKKNIPLNKVSFEKLKSEIKVLIPNEPFEIDYEYFGAFRITKNNIPYIGKDKKTNIYYSLCYGGNGIVFATMGGKILEDFFKKKNNYYEGYVSLER